MEVSNYKAYRIVDVINGSEYNVGDALTIEKYSLDDYIPKIAIFMIIFFCPTAGLQEQKKSRNAASGFR